MQTITIGGKSYPVKISMRTIAEIERIFATGIGRVISDFGRSINPGPEDPTGASVKFSEICSLLGAIVGKPTGDVLEVITPKETTEGFGIAIKAIAGYLAPETPVESEPGDSKGKKSNPTKTGGSAG